jgi:hypothetical protein
MKPRHFNFLAGIFSALAICATNAESVSTNSPATNSISVPKPLKDFLSPAPKNGGFAMDGYVLWCSSVIKVGDTYNMFASAWPGHKTTNGWTYSLGDWTSQSECVRATSTNLFGPYQFQEVVLQKRPGKWDNSRVHNVKIVKAGNKFVLFYINSANQTGYAVADSVNGPWTRVDAPVIKASNPAPIVNSNGSVYVFCRLRDSDSVNRGVAFLATNYSAPYLPVANGENLLPDGGELEDPTIWWANNQYNIVLNDWKGHATGVNKNGAQYFSKDGIHYTLVSREPVFTKTVPFDDGTSETFSRRERPFIYFNEKGEAIALFTACMPADEHARIVVQPIKNYYPDNK